jgi:hypothetical protein
LTMFGVDYTPLARFLSGWARVIAQPAFAFAALGDIPQAASVVGYRNMFQQIPAMRFAFRSARNGEIDDGLMEAALAADLPFWHERELGSMGSARYEDPFEEAGGIAGSMLRSKGDKPGIGERVRDAALMAERFSAKPLQIVDESMRRLVFASSVQMMADLGRKGRRPNKRTLRIMGLTDDEGKRLFEAVNTYARRERGQKVTEIDYQTWRTKDPDTYAMWGESTYNLVNTAVPMIDAGDIPIFMSRKLGQLIMQFRRWTFGTHERLVLAGIHQGAITSAVAAMTTAFTGGLLHYGRMAAVMSTAGEDQKERFREMFDISSPRILALMASRSAYSGMFPMLADTALMPILDKPLFSYRASTLDNALRPTSIPAVNILDRAMKTARNVTRGTMHAVSGGDYGDELTHDKMNDALRLLPGSTFPGVKNIIDFGGGLLPLNDD